MQKSWLFLFFILSPFTLQAQDMARVRKNIETLCSPEMHGRGYVKDGDKKAAAFIQKQFQEAGLKKFYTGYFQNFTMPVNTIREAKLTIDGRDLKLGQDFIPNPANKTGKGKLKILKPDSLIYYETKLLDLFVKQRFSGKAIIVPEKFKDRTPDKIYYKEPTFSAKIISHPEKLTYSVSQGQFWQPQFDVLENALGINPRKLKYKIAAEFIPDYQTQNVIGYVTGKTKPDSFLVFTAHYDHLGRIDDNTFFPGANDNASGASLLLELAHHFSQPENQPDYSIAFMAFSGEEAGLVGSKFYVEDPLFPLQHIKFLINLDLTGTGEEGLMVVNGKIHEKEFAQLQKLNIEKRYFPALKSRGAASNSDHYPFSKKHVPAFFFYTLGGVTFYHDINDKPETLPLTKYPELFKLILDFTQLLSPKR